jgi:hypothetical protein
MWLFFVAGGLLGISDVWYARCRLVWWLRHLSDLLLQLFDGFVLSDFLVFQLPDPNSEFADDLRQVILFSEQSFIVSPYYVV